MYNISNEKLSVGISQKGAELQNLVNKETGIEYLWQAGEEWPKRSPVLFPIVGGLKDDSYKFENKTYRMGRHGFARDKEFQVEEQQEESIIFKLVSDEDTRKTYPFDFKFLLRYSLDGNAVNVTYFVYNTGPSDMFFSVGGHPAFNVPLTTGTTYEDYRLDFLNEENAGRWPLSKEGLLLDEPVPYFSGKTLQLKKEMFYGDALVFKKLNSNVISLLNNKNEHGLTVSFPDFPFLGIWATKDADFVCIEPWCGIADSVNTSGDLKEKEGISHLEAGAVFERTFSIGVF